MLNERGSRLPFRSVNYELDQLVGEFYGVPGRPDTLGHGRGRVYRAGRAEPVPELGQLLGVD
jgi:hypothetical protein